MPRWSRNGSALGLLAIRSWIFLQSYPSKSVKTYSILRSDDSVVALKLDYEW